MGFDYFLPATKAHVPWAYLERHEVVGLYGSAPLFVGKRPEGVECTIYPDGKEHPEAMTYYKSSHGQNHSVINGIGRIGKVMWGQPRA